MFVRKFCNLMNAIDRRIDLRRLNDKMKELGIPLHIAPISHWYVDTRWQLEGLFGISDMWYPWGTFKKNVKDAYIPERWGGWFWLFEWGSRG